MSKVPVPATPAKKPSLIKKLAKAVAPDSYANIKKGVSSKTSLGSLKEGAKLAFNLPKEVILQPAARLVTQLGMQVASGGKPQDYTPGNVVTKNLLGRETVKPLDRELEDSMSTAYNYVKNNNPAVAGGASPDSFSSKLVSGVSTPFAALAIGGMKALDIEPGGSGGKKVLKEAGKELLEKTIKEGAERLAKEGTEQVLKEAPDRFLSKALQSSAPRYNYGAKAFTPAFESDLDKAAFILAQKKPSKREADFIKEAVDASGLTEAQLRAHGSDVKMSIKGLAKEAEPGTLTVPKMTPKPKAAQSSVPRLVSEMAAKADEAPMSRVTQTAPTGRMEAAVPPPGTAPGLVGSPVSAPGPGSNIPPSGLEDSLSYTDNLAQPKEAYNTKYLEIDPEDAPIAMIREGNKTIQELAAKGKQTGKPLRFAEIAARADEEKVVYDTLVSREETKDVAAQIFNLRRDIANDIQMGNFNNDFVAKVAKDQSAAADAARILNSRKMMASPQERSVIEEMVKKLTKQGEDSDKIIQTAKKYDLNDPEQQVKFYRELDKPKFGDWLDLVRYNSMLSSPTTHIVNTVSNAVGSGAVAPVEKALTGALDFARSAITGKPREAFVGEAPAYLKGYVKNLGEATHKFWDTLTGKSLGEVPDVRNLPLTEKGTAGRVLENTLKAPMTMLESMDQFFKTLTKGGELEALTYRASKGVSVPNIDKVADKKALYRLFRGELKGAEQGKLLDSIDDVTGAVLKLTQARNPVTRTIARFTMPFVKTPMNIFKQGIEYSPLGFATMWGADNKTEQLSKAIMGTATALGVATLVGDKRLTGAAPTSKDEYDRWKAAGIQPYSVKVGDKWISYQKLHPTMAYNFALVTSLDEALNNGKISEDTFTKVMGAFAKQAKFLADQSYMKSIGEFNQGLSGNPEKFSSVVANYPEQLVPFRAMLGFITRATDDVERQVDPNAGKFEKIMQEFFTQIPWKSDELQPRVNPKTGQPIQRPNKILNSLSPVRITDETPEAKQIQAENMSKQKYSGFAEDDKVIASERKRAALETYWELKNLQKDHAKNKLKQIEQSDPDLSDRVVELWKANALRVDTDAAELKKLNINTGSRARAVLQNMERFESVEEQKAYLKDLAEKKVINDDILDQMVALKTKQKATP